MAEMLNIQPSRACKCLNVRIWPQLHQEKQPDFLIAAAGDSEYTLTYVGDKGISIVHPQVTMRTRKIGPPIVGSSRCIRYTTLTCLLCWTVAYRVQQLVTSDEDLQEGPLLPSPDWVEQETLLSSSGWIEVHQDCLLAEGIMGLSSSSTYSSTFGIALPRNAITTAAPTPTQPSNASHQESGTQMNVPAGPFLYDLKPLFPPAPFVPSHPVFAHLSSIAVKASEHLRSSAEEQIAAIVQDKFAELETANDKLRHDVEELWRKFVENLGEVEKQMGPKAGETRMRDTSRSLSLSTSIASGTPLVSVRDFVPTPTTSRRVLSPSSSRSRVSTLSVSLATSGFHHPHMVQESTETHARSSSGSPRSPPPYSSHPSSLGSAEGLTSSSLESSLGVSPHLNGDNIMQPFKRSMDESRDTAVSFRYFKILEADVARARQQQPASLPNTKSECALKAGERAKATGDSGTAKVTVQVEMAEEAQAAKSVDRDVRPDGTARKRKVKFDITATGVASGGEPSQRVNGESRGNEDLIFDFEDASSEPESSDAAPTLPFIGSAQARRRGRHRVASHGALPASLSSLRPTSLPVYSALQSRGTAGSVTSASDSSAAPTSSLALPLQDSQPEYPERSDPQEQEILKLVAANTPSHRSAWKRNGKAWQLFVSRRRNGVPGALIPEETEDGSRRAADDTDDSDFGASRDIRWSLGNAGFPTSLPIDISPLARRKEPLSLASYQPKTALSDRAGSVPPVSDGRRHGSSANLRRASYAERDRSRAIDPGTLDFVAGGGEEAEDDESDEESNKAIAEEGRGRQRAFKILQARSKIPEAGMWMSLAS